MLKLDELLVVSLEQAVAAPFCSNRLAHAGARVIKIERAEGDFARGYDSVVHGESAYFIWLNQGKESLQLNIKQDADAELLHRILAQADVFIQNLAPAAAQRAGFGSEELLGRYPRLICCDLCALAALRDLYLHLCEELPRHDSRFTNQHFPHPGTACIPRRRRGLPMRLR